MDGTIAITRIHVKYRLSVPKGEGEAVARALEHHKERCPVALTLTRGVEFSFDADVEEEGEEEEGE